ncbi:hypothetical protein KC336_g88 [Hortaea werneckii]|nr:hypothetical protein KC336_g88 [Hortaea werneckii]
MLADRRAAPRGQVQLHEQQYLACAGDDCWTAFEWGCPQGGALKLVMYVVLTRLLLRLLPYDARVPSPSAQAAGVKSQPDDPLAPNQEYHPSPLDLQRTPHDLVISLLNFAKQINMVLSTERRLADDHLMEHSARRPQIGTCIVLLVAQNFRSHVQRGSTQGLGHGGGCMGNVSTPTVGTSECSLTARGTSSGRCWAM